MINTTTIILFLLQFLTGINLIAQQSLQKKINETKNGDTLYVSGLLFSEPIFITRPITLIGTNKPIIDGSGIGNVITIKSDYVTVSGFIIQNSGKNQVDEPSGIMAEGNYITLDHNEIKDVFFGITIQGGKKVFINNNYLHPGKDYGSRPGHVITIWNCAESEVKNNKIESGRDGIFLNYTANIDIENNVVTDCRYALHSMYSEKLVFANNYVYKNLLGCALMYSKNLVATGNRIEWQRTGSSPYGFLLKDIETLTMTGNYITANSIGIYAEGVSQKINSHSIIRNNVIEGNDVAFALHSTVNVDFIDNQVSDNLCDIQKMGQHISSETKWNENGSGNYWSNYRGYDDNNDGIGEQPFKVENILDKMTNPRNPLRVFMHTPAHRILESMMRMFPVLNGTTVMQDDFPKMKTSSFANEIDHTGLLVTTLVLSVSFSVLLFFLISKYAERHWL